MMVQFAKYVYLEGKIIPPVLSLNSGPLAECQLKQPMTCQDSAQLT